MGLNTSPIKVKTIVPDFNLKGKNLKEAFNVFMKKTHQEISLMAKDTLENSIRLTDAVATKTLLNSVYSRLLVGNSVDNFESNIGFQKPASEYAFFANYGRDAGTPPPKAAIQKWMQARGIPEEFTRRIVMKIAQEGTKGHFFIEKAEPIIDKNTQAILNRRIEEFKRTIN